VVDTLSLLSSAAGSRPLGAAVRCGGIELGYPDLRDLASRLASDILDAGARRGDRVVALFPNCHLFLACYFAALETGLVLVPINPKLSAGEMGGILEHSGARVIVGDPALVTRLAGDGPSKAKEGWRASAVPLAQTDRGEEAPPGIAHLYYTSGTTGRPKGVILTRDNLNAHVHMTLQELAIQSGDVWLHAAPMFHLADAWAVFSVTAASATHVMLPRFEPAAVFELIEAARVTITNLVPTMLIGLLAEAERRGRRLPSIRLLMSGGAPIAPPVVTRVGSVLGCEYVQTYGLTETSPFLTFSRLDEAQRALPAGERARQLARAGRAASGVDLRVVRPAGAETFEDVPRDDATVGEVVARGPTVTPGYWRDAAATREAFLGGWFHTGDLATIDRRGSINLVDRLKDVIITGGETVYSTEVENVLYAHPSVREAAVFGVPDDVWGEAVRAAVTLAADPATSPEDLVAFARQRLAHFKCPRAVDLHAALPRTGSGKIDKKALREPYWRGRPRRIN
jgi:acyl-CoA synthetase (AMP-forming)/AMP-acid ligase II